MRPIIAGPAYPAHRLGKLLDITLKLLFSHIFCFIGKDNGFLSYLPTATVFHSLFVSFYVTNLYMNIPCDLWLITVNYWVKNSRHYSDDIICSTLHKLSTGILETKTETIIEDKFDMTFKIVYGDTNKRSFSNWDQIPRKFGRIHHPPNIWNPDLKFTREISNT